MKEKNKKSVITIINNSNLSVSEKEQIIKIIESEDDKSLLRRFLTIFNLVKTLDTLTDLSLEEIIIEIINEIRNSN